jgi:hypothetical protein
MGLALCKQGCDGGEIVFALYAGADEGADLAAEIGIFRHVAEDDRADDCSPAFGFGGKGSLRGL